MKNSTRSVSEGQRTESLHPRRTVKGVSTAISIALMLIGVAMVCQPFVHVLFRYGFLVTLAGIVAFTVASNLPERNG